MFDVRGVDLLSLTKQGGNLLYVLLLPLLFTIGGFLEQPSFLLSDGLLRLSRTILGGKIFF